MVLPLVLRGLCVRREGGWRGSPATARAPLRAAGGSVSSERGGKFLASGAVPEGARKFPEEPLDTEGRCAKLRRTRKLPATGGPNGSWPGRGLERPYGASA